MWTVSAACDSNDFFSFLQIVINSSRRRRLINETRGDQPQPSYPRLPELTPTRPAAAQLLLINPDVKEAKTHLLLLLLWWSPQRDPWASCHLSVVHSHYNKIKRFPEALGKADRFSHSKLPLKKIPNFKFSSSNNLFEFLGLKKTNPSLLSF